AGIGRAFFMVEADLGAEYRETVGIHDPAAHADAGLEAQGVGCRDLDAAVRTPLEARVGVSLKPGGELKVGDAGLQGDLALPVRGAGDPPAGEVRSDPLPDLDGHPGNGIARRGLDDAKDELV